MWILLRENFLVVSIHVEIEMYLILTRIDIYTDLLIYCMFRDCGDLKN